LNALTLNRQKVLKKSNLKIKRIYNF